MALLGRSPTLYLGHPSMTRMFPPPPPPPFPLPPPPPRQVEAIYFDKIGLMTVTNNNKRQDAYRAGGRSASRDDGDSDGDIPLLMQFEEGVTISPILATVNYAIAFPMHSSLREDVNQGIARLEGGELVFRCRCRALNPPRSPLFPSHCSLIASFDADART